MISAYGNPMDNLSTSDRLFDRGCPYEVSLSTGDRSSRNPETKLKLWGLCTLLMS